MTPDIMVAVAAGAATTAFASLIAVGATIADNRKLRAKVRDEQRHRLAWLQGVTMPEVSAPARIPKGQPGAGRFVSTKETELTG